MRKTSGSGWLAVVLVGFAVAGCKGKADGATAVQKTSGSFEIYVVPGRMAEAKAMRFLDCKAEYNGYECKSLDKLFLAGVPARWGRLKLEYRDHFSKEVLPPEYKPEERTPEKLSYDSIRVEIGSTSYDRRCVKKKRGDSFAWPAPIECRTNDEGTDYLRFRLEQDGWKIVTQRRYTEYMKQGVPVSITIGSGGATTEAVIRRVEDAERDDALARETTRAEADAAKAQSDQEFYDAMRK